MNMYICGTDAKLQVHLVRPAPSFKNETLKWAMRIKHKLHFNHLITLALVAHHKRSLLQKLVVKIILMVSTSKVTTGHVII